MAVQSSKLLLKQMPCSLEELAQLIQECRLIVPRTLNSYGRKRALLEYGDLHEAAKALEQLQGLSQQLDKPLNISAFGPRDKPAAGLSNKATQTAKGAAGEVAEKDNQEPEIDKYVRRLYACNNHCDFSQPPPPYLSYSYPPINAEILARIGQQLQVNKGFYNQVLHLMNRMNLEPPFQKRSSNVLMINNHQNVATQTELVPSDPESELESEDDQQAKRQRLLPAAASEKMLKRTRHMLQQAAAQQGSHSNPQTETPKASFKAAKIELKLPETLKPVKETPVKASASIPKKRLTLSELQALPIYKNYKQGEPSNKLYLKNLDKSVDEQQLRELYSRFASPANLDIKVMQQGRMKGQAFVTFLNEASAAEVIAQALSETNGLVWHLKPMIVCYGKQQ
ncbi:uncharacterized protein Snp isoform X1 [Drosophila kikkawai]|uniref:Uncharacterized protein Snp isoform X1 n=1 Tax=Drosophila kikkawai TaxID=30033 RepID=A0A6P4JNK8_DROKI|nr:U11/U12 small nuclear ribonucleoprotein 65 kDa protein isoform X1 [Drosophila kikkawai]